MAQPSVAAYFATKKRRASGELRNKAKVLALDDNERLAVLHEEQRAPATSTEIKVETKKDMVSRNLQFDLGSKSKPISRSKPTRIQRPSTKDKTQCDIRETLFKTNKEGNNIVLFEKLGNLSPKKSPQKRASRAASQTVKNEIVKEEITEPHICKTPKKEANKTDDMSLDRIKAKITTSSRLNELRARIAKFKSCEEKSERLEQTHQERKVNVKKNEEAVNIRKFDHIEIEIPVSPQKTPRKFFSPTKTITLSPKASPARRLLFEPKEAPASPVKASPTKAPAYQAFVDKELSLPLPFKYRFLAEIFRSIDTVCAMLYNRRENITFSKLKPAVQELVRRNFTLDHLAQIKTVYPEAFSFKQVKQRSFGASNPEKYELVISPVIEVDEERSGRNTPDEDNVLKSAQQTRMSPTTLLERRRKFTSLLINLAKNEHEKFLLSLEKPMKIDKEKITMWHPKFDVDECKDIQKADLPTAPVQEKTTSAAEVLERASKLFNDGSRMKKALEMLTENRSANCTASTDVTEIPDSPRSVDISIIDTPPATPKVQKPPLNSMLKGIPASLLEKIRAKQAAKELEMMTRTPAANKDAIKYARLPEMSKILRNIFVGEKKNVLTMEFVIKKLDDSYRTKLTHTELEEHIRLLSNLLPLWATVHVVKNVDYLKLAKDYDMTKVMRRLEVIANEKVR